MELKYTLAKLSIHRILKREEKLYAKIAQIRHEMEGLYTSVEFRPKMAFYRLSQKEKQIGKLKEELQLLEWIREKKLSEFKQAIKRKSRK